MKIAVYGATGMVGADIVSEAMRRNHEVTAITRSGSAVEEAAAVAADLTDVATLQDIAATHDAVVLSIAPDRTGGSHDPYLAAHESIADATVPARVLVIGGAGALEVGGVQLKDLPDFPEEYKAEAITMGAILDSYRKSTTLDWTMLAPAPGIAPGERTGSYTLGLDTPAGSSITTADFAIAALDELENPRHRQQRFNAAN